MSERRGDAGGNQPGQPDDASARRDDLDRRRRELDAALSARRPNVGGTDAPPKSGGMAGLGNALRLSSEFIAAIVVGAVIGWLIDRYAGTSPFGLIVFLLLGFAAGVLNAMRAAGLVAQFGARKPDRDDGTSGKN